MKDGKHVILCIDDDPVVLEVLRLILEEHGYCMVEASSAEEGLKVFKASAPDFILVDLMMEEIDAGRKMVRELQRLGNRAPVYMLTSAGDSLVETMDFSDLGLMGVFQKPLVPETLVRTIRSQLS